MAYLIFSKENKGLYKIFEDDNELNNSLLVQSLYEIKTISDADFNDMQLGIKGAELDSQNNIVYIVYSTIPNFGIQSKKQLLTCFNNRLSLVGSFINNNNNSNHFQYSEWQNFYKTLTKYVDNPSLLDDVVYPLNLSFEQFLQSKGESVLNVLQLP
jgi:hypothetical protein